MTTEEILEDIGPRPCGNCYHPECRECFPWPTTDTEEVRTLREENLLLREGLKAMTQKMENFRGEYHRIVELYRKKDSRSFGPRFEE